MKKNIKGLLIGIMAVLMLLVSCGKDGGGEKDPADKVYDVYLGCDSPEDTVTYILLDKFATLMEEKSNGRIRAKRYSNAKLGGDIELIEALQHGKVTFVVQNTAPQVNFVPELCLTQIILNFGKLLEQILHQ